MAKQAECTEFLQWCLPQMRMRWPGFRKVRSQVCKRIARRLRELELEDHEAYKRYLASNAAEWARLDDFEGPAYRRTPVRVATGDGEIDASIYELA